MRIDFGMWVLHRFDGHNLDIGYRMIHNRTSLKDYRSSKVDPLSDIIALLRPSTAVSKPITGRGRWGVRYAAHHAPGFTLILQGDCWVAFEGKEPVKIQEGDFLLVPSTPAFSMYSHPGIECEPGEPVSTAVQHGDQDGAPDFVSLGGTFRIEQVNAPLMLALLPDIIHIRASEGRTGKLGRVIRLIADECASEDPGKEMVLQRLLEVLLVEALRWRSINPNAIPSGLLNGMHDPALARVLRAVHADVRAGWTVLELAKMAGMSRSAFASRFGDTLGCGPIEYVARWRMALAKDALTRGAKTLDRIADEIGMSPPARSAQRFASASAARLAGSRV
jgi:AraC-like DNA-binding protein